jgi:putative MATE family efflux protein
MIPVVIQQLINTLFNVVDTVMVGSLGELSMSAVAVANKPGMIYNGFLFGLTGAGGILISQYYGAGDHDQCQSLFSLEMLLSGLISALYACALFFFPAKVMGIYVQDGETIALGVSYLTWVSASYLFAAVSSVCIFSMRALGRNKLPMAVSVSALLMNAFFNYLFIFGKLGMPKMGVAGAAVGTLLSRFIEMCIYLLVLLRHRNFFSLRLNALFHIRAGVLKSFIRRAAPLTMNEFLWSSGLNVFFWAYARLDEPSIPAMVIADQAFMMGFVFTMGMSSAISVLIGTQLGAGNLAKARQNCKQLLMLQFLIAIGCSLVSSAASFGLPYIFPVQEHLRGLSTQLTLVYSLFFPISAVYNFCFFCLRAGGETRSAALLDSGYMWALPIPVSLGMAFLGQGRIPLLAAVFIVQLLMNLKITLALRIVRRGRWIRNITLEG